MPHNLQIISPHRDDAALSLTLSILHWLRHGLPVCIINCFTRSSFTIHSSQNDLDAVSAARLAEDQALLRLLGQGVVMTDLGHADYIDRPGWTPDQSVIEDRPLDAAEQREIDALAQTLAPHLGPGPILLPSCSGPHRDHLIAVHATQKARTDQPVAVYDDLPYTIHQGRETAEARAHQFAKLFGVTFSPIQLGDPDDIPLKRAALEAYPSQLDQPFIDTVIDYSQTGERVWVDDHARPILHPEAPNP